MRKQNKSLPPRLLSHEIFGRLPDRAVDKGGKISRNAKPPEGRRKLVTRRCQSLQSLDAFVEVNDARLIFALSQNLIKKCVTRMTLLFQYPCLAAAGVN